MNRSEILYDKTLQHPLSLWTEVYGGTCTHVTCGDPDLGES